MREEITADPHGSISVPDKCMEVDEDDDIFFLPNPPCHLSTDALASETTLKALNASSSEIFAALSHRHPEPDRSDRILSSHACAPSSTASSEISTLPVSTIGLRNPTEVKANLCTSILSHTKPEHQPLVPTHANQMRVSSPTPAPNEPSAREQLDCYQVLLPRLKDTLFAHQKKLEVLGRVRARHRALQITKLVSRRQQLQREVASIEALVSTYVQHDRELRVAKARVHACIRSRSVCMSAPYLQQRGYRQQDDASLRSHVHGLRNHDTDEVYAACGGVWIGAKSLAKAIKQKSKRIHGRAKAVLRRESCDASMHGSDELNGVSSAGSGVFVAAMECAQGPPQPHVIAESELATR
jgi:hypothetical protein